MPEIRFNSEGKMKRAKTNSFPFGDLILATVIVASTTVAHASSYRYLSDLEGTLTTYCGADKSACAVVIDKFNEEVLKANGGKKFEATFERLSTSEMIARVSGELEKSASAVKNRCSGIKGDALEKCKDNTYRSNVDLLFYGTDDPYRAALGADLFSKFNYRTAGVQGWARDLTYSSGGRLGGLYLGLLSIGVNTELLAQKGISVPTCWSDLSKPEFKGQVVMANWNTSGTAYKFASNMLQAYGSEEAGWEMIRAIHKNVSEYTRSGSKGVKMAARGETLAGIGFAHDIVKLKQKGFPIELVTPCEGVLYEIGPVAIVRGAKNRTAAEAFATFLYELEVQEILPTVGALQFPSNIGSSAPAQAPDINSFKLIYSDPVFSTESKKNAIIEKWTTEIFPSAK